MTDERRRDPRVDLFAQIEIPRGEGLVEIVKTHDVSLGGMFLIVGPKEHPWIVVGKVFELTLVELPLIFASEDAEVPENQDLLVRATGKVVRRTTTGSQVGAGIAFVDLHPDHRERLRRIIERSQAAASR